jgi:integrase
LTFGAVADRYLARLRETDAKDYPNNEAHLRLHLVPYLGAMRADKIADFTIQKYKRHCRDKGLSDATINRTLATFRRMGRRMADNLNTPFPAVKIPRETTSSRTYVLSETDEATLLSAALSDSNSFVWLFIKIALATSLRHSEVLSARFEHFDPVKRRLGVRVKGGLWRKQPLTRNITQILQRERSMASDPEGWIFPNPTTSTGHYDRMVKSFRRCVVQTGLDPIALTPHALRHTANTRLVAAGTDIKTVMEFSGHQSLEMVMRYTHAQDRTIDAALDRMDSRTIVELPTIRVGAKP